MTTNKETLLRAGWRILVTNVDQGILDAQKVSDIYALRWNIEIKFRAFKQSCQLSRGLKHKSGHHHVEVMVLAAMLYQLLTINLHSKMSCKPAFNGWLSIEKLSDAFFIHLMRLTI
jgi:IS4 transposase